MKITWNIVNDKVRVKWWLGNEALLVHLLVENFFPNLEYEDGCIIAEFSISLNNIEIFDAVVKFYTQLFEDILEMIEREDEDTELMVAEIMEEVGAVKEDAE